MSYMKRHLEDIEEALTAALNADTWQEAAELLRPFPVEDVVAAMRLMLDRGVL